MDSNILLVVFALWVLFQVWRGYRDGFWCALLSLAGFVLAYAVTFFYGAKVNTVVASWGFDHDYRIFLVYPALFLSVSFLVRRIPLFILPVLKKRSRAGMLGGAALGLASGVVSGLIAIWFLNVAQAAIAGSGNVPQVSDVPRQEPGKLGQAASLFVAESAEIGLKLAGASDTEAAISAKMIREPDQSFASMQSLLSSAEMQSLMLNPRIQSMMATNDSGSLMASDEFQSLLRLPDMQNLMNLLHVENEEPAESERFVAEQLTFIWRRLNYLKHDPRVKDALQDEQIQTLLREKNFPALLMNTKFQSLVGLIMDRGQDMSSVDFTQYVESGTQAPDSGSDSVKSPVEVYRWVDAEGGVRYAEWNHVPEAYRASAEKFLH